MTSTGTGILTKFFNQRRIALPVVVAAGLASGTLLGLRPTSAQDRGGTLAWHQVFQKADTWPETMLVSRRRYRRWRVAGPSDMAVHAVDLALRRMRVADPQFAVYEQRVRRDWSQLRLTDPNGGKTKLITPLDWFNSTNTQIDRALIRLVLDRMQSDCAIAELITAPFRAQLAELQRENIPPDDPRWLQLYCTVTDWEKDLEPLRGLDTFRDSAQQIARQFAGECVYTPDALFGELERLDGRWRKLREPLLRNPDQARPQVVKLVDQYAALRDRVHFGLRPVREFLAECTTLDMKAEWREQWANLIGELQRRDWYRRPEIRRQTLRRDALIFDSDRDPTDVVLRRTRALLEELKRADGIDCDALCAYGKRLDRLERIARTIAPRLVDARKALF
ncbi:MAG: hypothetical protein GXP27_02070, partial [Planctomycetes bacterium]|nr:hypothetical protein [Planctomycetota bacterium]